MKPIELEWKDTVVLCPTLNSGRWKIVGKLFEMTAGEEPYPLLLDMDVDYLREQLRQRGYTREQGEIDATERTGIELYRRRPDGN